MEVGILRRYPFTKLLSERLRGGSSAGGTKRIGARPISQDRSMADEPRSLAPEMELVARRLENEL